MGIELSPDWFSPECLPPAFVRTSMWNSALQAKHNVSRTKPPRTLLIRFQQNNGQQV